ncbi:MAG: oxidoreductase, partial [Actinomycetes bacterium]
MPDPMTSRSTTDRPARLAVGVIGVGRVGGVLAVAVRNAGHPIVAAAAVSDTSLARLDALLPGTPGL